MIKQNRYIVALVYIFAHANILTPQGAGNKPRRDLSDLSVIVGAGISGIGHQLASGDLLDLVGLEFLSHIYNASGKNFSRN